MTHEATQKIHRMKVNPSKETMEAMIEVPRARMKKMYAPPKIKLKSDTKSVYLKATSSLVSLSNGNDQQATRQA